MATAIARLVTEWDRPSCTCPGCRDKRVNERRTWAVVCQAVPENECGLLSLPYLTRAAAIKAAREHRHDEGPQ